MLGGTGQPLHRDRTHWTSNRLGEPETTMDTERPTVTVFGSCRVHEPCLMLHKSGVVRMDQGNIFGFVHYTSEVFQQFELVAGARAAPPRLRPFLNIPDHWRAPERQDIAAFRERFEATDVFVVEISSIRKLIFKALFLQINRTRELLVRDDETQKNWWAPLVRYGENRTAQYNLAAASELQKEIVTNLQVKDLTFDDLVSDMRRIKRFLRKPVLFVSHFNTDYQGKSVPQRKLIVDAMEAVAVDAGCRAFDPTPHVLDAGLENSIKDLGHYKPGFEARIAERLREEIRLALRPASAALAGA
jgi:hypothetical protein